MNKSVFSLHLTISKLSADRVCTESEFQMSGAATVKTKGTSRKESRTSWLLKWKRWRHSLQSSTVQMAQSVETSSYF